MEVATPDLPSDLQAEVRLFNLPVDEAWHITNSVQLLSNRITDIMTISTYSTPRPREWGGNQTT